MLLLKPLDDDDDDVENGRREEESAGDFVDACLNKVFVFDDEEEHSNQDRSRRVIFSTEALARPREKAFVVCISFSFQVRLCQMNNDEIFRINLLRG